MGSGLHTVAQGIPPVCSLPQKVYWTRSAPTQDRIVFVLGLFGMFGSILAPQRTILGCFEQCTDHPLGPAGSSKPNSCGFMVLRRDTRHISMGPVPTVMLQILNFVVPLYASRRSLYIKQLILGLHTFIPKCHPFFHLIPPLLFSFLGFGLF